MSKVKENFKSLKKGANIFVNKSGLKYSLTTFHIIMAIVLFIKATKQSVQVGDSYKKSIFEYVMGFLILIFGTAYGLLLILGNSK